MEWHVALLTFALILPVELPDKTFVATLVLSTRYRALAVWVGVGAAFGVQSLVAVTAGHLVTYLPQWVTLAGSIALFLLGATILIRSAPDAELEQTNAEQEFERRFTPSRSGWRAILTSFLVLFAAEWGDLSQLLTINMVAKYGSPVSSFVGAWAALLTVSGLAVLGGRVLLGYMRISVLHYIGAAICLVLAVAGSIELATS